MARAARELWGKTTLRDVVYIDQSRSMTQVAEHVLADFRSLLPPAQPCRGLFCVCVLGGLTRACCSLCPLCQPTSCTAAPWTKWPGFTATKYAAILHHNVMPSPCISLVVVYVSVCFRACSYGQRFDMVTCTNTLSELTTDDERARVVDELWDRVAPGGVLVLVDRGNGWGFHCIQTARDALLERETARANAHQFRNLRSVGRGQSEGRGSGADGDPLTAACVVAPCAHAQKVGLRVGVGV